jgi:hypothetical protein
MNRKNEKNTYSTISYIYLHMQQLTWIFLVVTLYIKLQFTNVLNTNTLVMRLKKKKIAKIKIF